MDSIPTAQKEVESSNRPGVRVFLIIIKKLIADGAQRWGLELTIVSPVDS
jgi:hypothetical protein